MYGQVIGDVTFDLDVKIIWPCVQVLKVTEGIFVIFMQPLGGGTFCHQMSYSISNGTHLYALGPCTCDTKIKSMWPNLETQWPFVCYIGIALQWQSLSFVSPVLDFQFVEQVPLYPTQLVSYASTHLPFTYNKFNSGKWHKQQTLLLK